MRFALTLLGLLMCASSFPVHAASLPDLQSEFETITTGFKSRVGVCVDDGKHQTCINGEQRFSMQSVVKMITGMTVWDAVDHGQFKIDDPILIRKHDLTLGVQPIAEEVGEQGLQTTFGDLVRRTIIQSDTTANDVLMDKLGGPSTVQGFLNRKQITGVRVDRDERHLQTNIIGTVWKPDYADPDVRTKAFAAISKATRDKAYTAYLTDPRDTATPYGMATLLYKLVSGTLVSPAATQSLMTTLRETKTFPTRLKAGLQDGWQIGHKTGSSDIWNGITAATNDVGFLTTPDGKHIAIAVFVADSSASDDERNAIIARLSRATVDYYSNSKF